MFRKLKDKIVESPVFPGIPIILMGVISVVVDRILSKEWFHYLPAYSTGLFLAAFGVYALIIGLKESKPKK